MQLLLLCGATAFSFGQKVLTGSVYSTKTNEPIVGAVVRNFNDATTGTVTDWDGNFVLKSVKPVERLLITYIGHKSDTINITSHTDSVGGLKIKLTPDPSELKNVVVSSGKFEQKLEEVTTSIEVIKPDLIANKNTTSIETAIEQAPGVTVIDNDPQIRGGSGFTFGVGSRVAIVVDGIPLLSGDAGKPEWNYIPVENISQIEIIKGSSSVLFGSSAINGVINIRSAYPGLTPKTVVSYSAGVYASPQAPADNWYNGALPGFSNLNFLHSQMLGKNFDLVIGGNFNVDQGYIGPAPAQGYIDPTTKHLLKLDDSIPVFNNRDMLKQRARLNFNLRYRFPNIKGLNVGLNGNLMTNKTNMPLAWLDDSAGLYKSYPGAVFLENQTFFNIDPFVRFNKGNGWSHSIETRIFHTDDLMTNNQSTNGTMYYGEYQLQRKIEQWNLNATAGVMEDFSTTRAKIYDSNGKKANHVNNASVFFQLDKKLFSALNVSAGVRYEYFKTNNLDAFSKPVFRAGANLKLAKGTWLRSSIGQGLRYPSITERYISTKAGLFGVFPNPEIKPESSVSSEIGIKQGFQFGKLRGFLDLAAFNQKYHNTIEYLFGVWDPTFSFVGFKFVNTGDSRVRGLDLSLAFETAGDDTKFGISGLIGYTYIDPVSLTPNYVYAQGKNLSGGPGDTMSFRNSSMDTTSNTLKYRFKHMGKADVEFRYEKLTLGISYRYYSKMKNIDKAFQTIEDLTKNFSDVFPGFQTIQVVNYWKNHNGFSVFDVRMGYKLNKKHKVSLVCNNIFNTVYFLRPLKIESPRTVALQYVLTLE